MTTTMDDADFARMLKPLADLRGCPMDDIYHDMRLAIELSLVVERNRSSAERAPKVEIDRAISNASAATASFKRNALAAVGGSFKARSKRQVFMDGVAQAMHSAQSSIGDWRPWPVLPQTPYDPDLPPLSELAQSVASLTQLVGRPEFIADASIAMALEKVKSIMKKRLESVGAATDQSSVLPCPRAYEVDSTTDIAMVQQEERHQEAMRALFEDEEIDKLFQVKINLALSKQKDEHDRAIHNLEQRYQHALRQLRDELVVNLAQHENRHQFDLKVIRDDVLDLEHSILQAKSAPSKSGSTTKPVDHVSPRASLASRGSMWGHKLFNIPPVNNTGAPAGPAAGKEGVSQPTIFDMAGSDDADSTVSALSDDDICILEPTEVQAFLQSSTKLAKGSSKPSIKTPTSVTTGAPAPSSPTFDNTGPLAVGPSQLNRLLRTALLLNAAAGQALLFQLERPGNTGDRTFGAFVLFMDQYYEQAKGEAEDKTASKVEVWRQLRAVLCQPMQAGSFGVDGRPPLWEGCGPQGIGEERK